MKKTVIAALILAGFAFASVLPSFSTSITEQAAYADGNRDND